MGDVIRLDQFRRRDPIEENNPIVQALDALALALSTHDHKWNDRDRLLYETAISYCGCTDSDS